MSTDLPDPARLPEFPPPSLGEPAYGVRTDGAGAATDGIDDVEATAEPRRRARRPLLVAGVSLAAAAVLAGAFWGWSVFARAQADEAQTRLSAAIAERSSAEKAFDARMRSVDGQLGRVQSVVAAPEFAAQGPAQAEPFRSAVAAFESTRETVAAHPDSVAAAAASEAGAPPATGAPAESSTSDAEGYTPPWQLMAETSEADAGAARAHSSAEALVADTSAAAAAEKALETAETAYFSSVAAHARDTISASALSTKASQVALTRIIEVADDPGLRLSHDAALLASITTAERAVADSAATEAAEAADPALAVRNEIEAYARSISRGVTLDFVWAPEVSGRGEGWLSGTAEMWDGDGGWATISLNFPVEQDWSYDDNARALVTHEVGHSQVVRPECRSLFEGPAFAQDHEMWATAWAISQGFDLPGAGIEAYGRPSDEQIAVAAQCV